MKYQHCIAVFCFLIAIYGGNLFGVPTAKKPSIGRYVTMNDNGQIAFIGSTVDGSNNILQNIYTCNSSSVDKLNVLMNSIFELPYRSDFLAPSAQFSAPMIDNSGNVLAWRYLGASAALGIGIGGIQSLALTYIETWPFAGTILPPTGIPLAQIIMGNEGAAAAYPFLLFTNPSWGNTYPSAFDTSSPWVIVFGPGNSFPAQNNNGLVAFCGQIGGNNYLATSQVNKSQIPGNLLELPGALAFPSVSDTGLIVATIDDGGTRSLRLFTDPTNMKFAIPLTSSEFSSVGIRPAINKAGTIVAFYGIYQGSNPSFNKGPGLFAAISGTSGEWALVNVAAIFDSSFIDSNLSVNNSGQIIFKASNANSTHPTSVAALFTINVNEATFAATKPIVLQSVGNSINGKLISDLEFYAGLSNSGDVAYWVKTDTGHIAFGKVLPKLIPSVVDLRDGVNIENGGTVFITGDDPPKMPNFRASIVNGDLDKTYASWKLTVTSDHARRAVVDRVSDARSFSASVLTTSNWDINSTKSNDFFGGAALLKAIIPKKTLPDIQFEIAGKNPDNAAVIQCINSQPNVPWYAQYIAQEETHVFGKLIFNQFCEKTSYAGKIHSPVWGTPDGWGIMQVDSARGVRVPTADLWNWRTNVADGVKQMLKARTSAISYFNGLARKYKTQYEEPPETIVVEGTKTAITALDAAAIQDYNGGTVTKLLPTPFKNISSKVSSCWEFFPNAPTGHKWKFKDNEEHYVTKILNQYETNPSGLE